MRSTRIPRWKSAVAGLGAAAAIGGFTAALSDAATPERTEGAICLLCWLISTPIDPDPEPPVDPDDLWQSECDAAGDCESVPNGGFMDPGPGAPGGPHGPLW
jgi:hypothetical protein